MAHEPGEVWFLPPDAEEGGDPKGRRHVLLTPMAPFDDLGIFAYASTQPTEARFGAARLFVDPASSSSPRPGFTRPSYVYLGRLVPARSKHLLRMTGQLLSEMPQLRRALREALGVGRTGSSPPIRDSGWRGRVARLAARRSEAIGFRHGIVVTEPLYSRCERYQIIVPIGSVDELTPEPGDLIVTNGDWLRSISPGGTEVLVAIADVQSVFHSADIDSWTGAVVDEATMKRIDAALIDLFDL